MLFDAVVSRYLVAGMLVAVVWLPCYLACGTGFGWWLWPTLALGVALCGLWDGCAIFTAGECFVRRGWLDGGEK